MQTTYLPTHIQQNILEAMSAAATAMSRADTKMRDQETAAALPALRKAMSDLSTFLSIPDRPLIDQTWEVGHEHPDDAETATIHDRQTGEWVAQTSDLYAHRIALVPKMVDLIRRAIPLLEELETWEHGNGGAEVLPEADDARQIIAKIDMEDETA